MTGRSRPLASAAIIVRDEAELLRRCLASIADWCEELVVVDTGSIAHTVEVARSFGAKVDHFPWVDDFAAARNRSLDLVTGEWVLYVDADEWLEPLTKERAAAEFARHPDAVAIQFWRRDRPIFTPYREYRLWRNRPDIRFVGRIHETMVPDILRVVRTEGLPIGTSDVFRLLHDGYEGDQTAKHQRNLPLLERRVTELPYRVYLWNHIGNIRQALGDDDGAVAAWAEGVEVVRRFGVVDRTDVLVYSGLGLHQISRGRDVTALLDELAILAPWYKTTPWMRACNHRRQGRHADAIAPLRTLIAMGPDTIDPSLAYNNAMFTEWAWEALADSLLRCGDRAGAAAVWAEAAAARPERFDYRVKSLALAAATAPHDEA